MHMLHDAAMLEALPQEPQLIHLMGFIWQSPRPKGWETLRFCGSSMPVGSISHVLFLYIYVTIYTSSAPPNVGILTLVAKRYLFRENVTLVRLKLP